MTDISIKISELLEMNESFVALEKATFPAKTSYWIGKLLSKVTAATNEHLKIFNNTRNDMLKNLGDLVDEKEMRYTVRPENIEEWNKGITNMLDDPVLLAGVMKIKLNEIEGIEVKPSTLIALDPILDEEE